MSDAVPVDGCATRTIDPERVASVRSVLPDDATVEALSEIFGLLSDPNRVRLLAALLEGGEMCVCDLAATTAMAESATSQALRLLRAHRVVKVRRAGRVAYYSLTDGHVRMILDVALEHLAHDDG